MENKAHNVLAVRKAKLSFGKLESYLPTASLSGHRWMFTGDIIVSSNSTDSVPSSN